MKPELIDQIPMERWGEKLREMAELCADELRAADPGLGPDRARVLGARVAVRLCSELGGTTYYWPMGKAFTREVLHLSIWSEYDGTRDGPNGILALAARYRMAEYSIQRILSRQKKIRDGQTAVVSR